MWYQGVVIPSDSCIVRLQSRSMTDGQRSGVMLWTPPYVVQWSAHLSLGDAPRFLATPRDAFVPHTVGSCYATFTAGCRAHVKIRHHDILTVHSLTFMEPLPP